MSISIGAFAASAARLLEVPQTPPKKDPAQIEQDYQVQDDKVVEYQPKAFFIPLADPVKITQTEAKLLDNLQTQRGLVGLNTFKNIRDDAFQVAEQRYPNPPIPDSVPKNRQKEWLDNDGHRDAFRHAYWNARLTKEFGAEWTAQYTTAHEGLPGNQSDREAMDLYNNEVGRRIATEHPDASEEELADLVQKAVEDGELLVIDSKGQLTWSNGVPYGQHGLADGKPAGGGQALPDGNVLPTNS